MNNDIRKNSDNKCKCYMFGLRLRCVELHLVVVILCSLCVLPFAFTPRDDVISRRNRLYRYPNEAEGYRELVWQREEVHTSTGITLIPRPLSLQVRHAKASSSEDFTSLKKVSQENEDVPIPFLDRTENSFIECYADSIITVKGVEYTIGIPCDYCVALCYFDDNQNLLPIELNDELMDDVFPFAENIVREEFDEELVLQRTPQTLTLVGELEEEDEDEDDFDEEDDDEYSGQDEVEVLITFEHRGKEYNLVRLLDPVLLVGKADYETDRSDLRVLLTPKESETIMPILENTFLRYHEDGDAIFP